MWWWWWWCFSRRLNRAGQHLCHHLCSNISCSNQMMMSSCHPIEKDTFLLLCYDWLHNLIILTKHLLQNQSIEIRWNRVYFLFFFTFWYVWHLTETVLYVFTPCVHVCYVSVFISKRWSRGSISHTWRKWGNLGPGVKEVMDFNAAIVVNGSLN